LIAGIKGNRGQHTAGREVFGQPLINGLAVAAQNLAVALQTLGGQTAAQILIAGNLGHRHHQVAPGVADQPLELALVVARARAAEPVLKQVVRLQLGEGFGPPASAIAQDRGHRQPRVVVEDRERQLSKEVEGRHMPVQTGLGCFRRIRLDEDRVRVRQVHAEEVQLPGDAADHPHGLAEIDLSMARGMMQGNEHLLRAHLAVMDVTLHDRGPARDPILIAKPLENPLGGMLLLGRHALIIRQDLIDDAGKPIQLRPDRGRPPPVPGRSRKRAHLIDRLAREAEQACRLTPAPTVHEDRLPNPQIKLHDFHAPAPRPLIRLPRDPFHDNPRILAGIGDLNESVQAESV